ncbi:N-acetyltransferase [Halomonas stenophila]|uniref:Putative N-acetyltransferase YhbS n=1 Tax=Halomonas stenophila TaxID=795312 RepID=A0A7W5EW57_9GAMM|nr:putative N-acetyltransferase YhbS [Halomonas stenophila]
MAEAFREAPHASHTEQFIVGALRRAGALTISLVAEKDGTLVGQVALSPVPLSDGPPGWYGLGPVAVIPARQGQGIGSRVVEEALARLHGLGAQGGVSEATVTFYDNYLASDT